MDKRNKIVIASIIGAMIFLGLGLSGYGILNYIDKVRLEATYSNYLNSEYQIRFLNNVYNYGKNNMLVNRSILISSFDLIGDIERYRIKTVEANVLLENETIRAMVGGENIDEENTLFVYKNGKIINDFNNIDNREVLNDTANNFMKNIYNHSFDFNKAKYKFKLESNTLKTDNNAVLVSATFPNDYKVNLSFPYYDKSIELSNISMSYFVQTHIKSERDSFFTIIIYEAKARDKDIIIRETLHFANVEESLSLVQNEFALPCFNIIDLSKEE